MIAEFDVKIDGRIYKKGESIPDLGSWVCINANGMVRTYRGESADVPKLPHYVSDGSNALCTDTGDVYWYYSKTDEWKKQG